MNLFNEFLKLEIPHDKANVFNTITVPEFTFAKIGIDKSGYPILLIHSDNDKIFTNSKNIRLKYLELSYNVECKITEYNQTQYDHFSVLIFRSNSKYFQQYFFQVSETFIRSLSKEPTQKNFLESFQNFVEIFQNLTQTPSKSVQGLWAELLLITISKNPMILINYWHVHPEEKYDFNSDIEKVEVKSSRNLERIHTFSSEQLYMELGKRVVIASLFVKQNSSGVSIEGLLKKIQKNVSDLKLLEKLNRVISKTLGDSVEEALEYKFDFDLARNSLKYYDIKDVPKINKENIPDKVFRVKYKSDLTHIRPLDKDQFMESGKLFKSL